MSFSSFTHTSSPSELCLPLYTLPSGPAPSWSNFTYRRSRSWPLPGAPCTDDGELTAAVSGSGAAPKPALVLVRGGGGGGGGGPRSVEVAYDESSGGGGGLRPLRGGGGGICGVSSKRSVAG